MGCESPFHHARGTGGDPGVPATSSTEGLLFGKTGTITVTNAVWIPGVFSCCFLNPQFSLYHQHLSLMPCLPPAGLGVQKEIRRELETKETTASETHVSTHCLIAALTLTRPELSNCATGRLSSCQESPICSLDKP